MHSEVCNTAIRTWTEKADVTWFNPTVSQSYLCHYLIMYVGHCNLWNDQNHLGTRVLPMAEVTLIRINGLWFDFQPQLGHVSSTHLVLVPSYGKIWLEWDTGSLQISLIRSVEWPKQKHNTNYELHQTAGDAPGSWLDLNFWFHYFAVAVFS